jgi:hypothetical protein
MRYELDDRRITVPLPVALLKLALGTTQPPVQSMPRTPSRREEKKSTMCQLNFHLHPFIIFFYFWRNKTPVGQGSFMHEVSRTHTTTHHSR